MPLKSGSSARTVSTNIGEMVRSGHPQAQAVAASLSNAKRHPTSRKGKNVQGRGGGKMARHAKRSIKRNAKRHSGR